MASEGTDTSTSTTGPDNPEVKATQTKLLKGLQGTYDSGVKVFGQSLYPGVGDTTRNSWQTTLGAANNPGYSAAINSTMGEFGDIAAGKRFGNDDPSYALMRKNLMDDAVSNVGSVFTGSGRFGGGSYVDNATESAFNAAAGLDVANRSQDIARQQHAAGLYPSLYQASLAPGMVQSGIGAAQDADALATRQGANELFRRQSDANWDRDARTSSILAGTAQAGGQTTTQTTPQAPWWQQVLGAGALGAGIYGNIWG